jgi:hypothetical protein
VRLHNNESLFYAGEGSIKIVYTGGYTSTTRPKPLYWALVQQTLYELNHSERIGLQGIRGDGASAEYDEVDGLARQVAEALAPYRLLHRSIVP